MFKSPFGNLSVRGLSFYPKLLREQSDMSMIQLHNEGKIATLTIHRPEALNALNSALLDELSEVVQELSTNQEISVLIITGEDRSFVAGADIAEMAQYTPEEALSFARKGAGLFRRIELLPQVVIASINGFCLGGGCELAMACDLRIASEKAKMGQPETGLGIPPGFGGTQRLPRLVGIERAKELIFSSRIIRADEALAIGLISKVVPHDELMSQTMTLAQSIAAQSPSALRLAKDAINRGIQSDIDTALSIENDLFALAFASPEQKEGMSAFLEKRRPQF